MKRWITSAAIAATVAVGVGAVGAEAAPASRATDSTAQPPNPRPKVAAEENTALDTANESTFTAITPCRIVDTRLAGGILASKSTRLFQVAGNVGFTAQGGSSTGCGIPDAATSVSMSVTATDETGDGYVTVYPHGVAKPIATVLSFHRSITISGNTNATLVPDGQIEAYVGPGAAAGSTQLVVDVTGYSIRPMRAEVSSTGSLVRGSRVTSVTHLRTGGYQIDFDRDVSGCAYAATSYFFSTTVQAQPRLDDPHGVYVATGNDDGIAADAAFYLIVTC